MNFSIIFILIFIFNCANSESAICRYRTIWKEYVCTLTFDSNLKSDAEITEITGEHQQNKTDADVKKINHAGGFNLTTFPPILCEKFVNIRKIMWINSKLENLDENSLKKCENLEELHMNKNKINKLHENTFAHQQKLKELHLNNNQLEELPKNIFSSLTSLQGLWLHNNKLKEILSDSFGQLTSLKSFYFDGNQVEKFDEQIIDRNKHLRGIDANRNPCTDKNASFSDSTESKSIIRAALKRCFYNFKCELNVPHRVCSLEDENVAMKKEIVENSQKINENIQTMQDELNTIDNNVNSLNDEMSKVSTKINEEMSVKIQSMSQEMNEKNEKLMKDNEELKIQVAALKTKNTEMENQMQAQIQALRDEMRKSVNEEINLLKKNLENTNHKMNEKFQSTAKHIQDLSRDDNNIKNDIITLKTHIENDKNETEKQIQTNVNSIKLLTQEIKMKIESLTQMDDQTKEETAAIRRRLADMTMKAIETAKYMEKFQLTMKLTKDHIDKTFYTHMTIYNQLMTSNRELTDEYKTITDTIKIITTDGTNMKFDIAKLQHNVEEIQNKQGKISEEVEQMGRIFIPQIRKSIIDLQAADRNLEGYDFMLDDSIRHLNSTSEKIKIDSKMIDVEFSKLKLKYYEFNDEIIKLQNEKREMVKKIKEIEVQMRIPVVSSSSGSGEPRVEIQKYTMEDEDVKFANNIKKLENDVNYLLSQLYYLRKCCP